MELNFGKTVLLNDNCLASSGGESISIVFQNGSPVAQIMTVRERSPNHYGWIIQYYEVEWVDGREDNGETFYVDENNRTMDAKAEARRYIRGNLS